MKQLYLTIKYRLSFSNVYRENSLLIYMVTMQRFSYSQLLIAKWFLIVKYNCCKLNSIIAYSLKP